MKKCTPNPELLEAHAQLKEFFNREDIAFDPWWWPLNDGSQLSDFGIESDPKGSIAGSLLLNKSEEVLNGFRGSLGAVKNCTMIITTRPSSGRFQVKGIGTIISILKPLVNQSAWPNIHLTDLVKFRGVGGDAAFDRGLTLDLWQASLDCLNKEIEALQPSQIFISKGAKKAIKAWLPKGTSIGGFGRWTKLLTKKQIELLTELYKKDEVPSITPRHFGGKDAAIAKRIETTAAYHKHKNWPKK